MIKVYVIIIPTHESSRLYETLQKFVVRRKTRSLNSFCVPWDTSGPFQILSPTAVQNIGNFADYHVALRLAEWRKDASVTYAIIGADTGLAPTRRQAIIWTNAGISSIVPLGTNFSEILSEIHILLFKEMHLKMSSAKWRQFCLGLNVLTWWCI